MARTAARVVASWVTVSVAGLGLLAAHCLGYHLVHLLRPGHDTPHGHAPHGHAAHADHAHLLPLASGAFLGTVVGALLLIVLAARRGSLPRIGLRPLLTLQVAGFLMLELGERVLQGDPWTTVATDVRVLAGLVLQIPVAYLVHRLGKRVGAAAVRFLSPPRQWAPVARAGSSVRATGVDVPVVLHWALRCARRGPPGWRAPHPTI